MSNLIYFGTGSTATTACFNTSGLAASAFKAFDNNLCHFAAAGGQWDSTRTTLASQRAAGLDLSSLNTDPSLSLPVAPLFLLMPSASSVTLRAGHPTLSSRFGQGGFKRDAIPDIGAFQLGATVVVPNSPTGMVVQ